MRTPSRQTSNLLSNIAFTCRLCSRLNRIFGVYTINSDMSAVDKKNVLDTWSAAYRDWDDKNGVAFYTRLFANNPKIKDAFTNCDIKLQSGLFGKMVQSWMENLENASSLDEKISGMCASHKKRGQTDMGLFKDALTELAGFIGDSVGMNGDQQSSWQKINEVILDIMKTKF